MREEITNMNEEVKEIKSFAMELYQDSKNANKRICRVFTIIILVIVIGYFVTVGLFLGYINELGYEEEIANIKTQEIIDIDTIENSNIVNGDVNGNN